MQGQGLEELLSTEETSEIDYEGHGRVTVHSNGDGTATVVACKYVDSGEDEKSWNAKSAESLYTMIRLGMMFAMELKIQDRDPVEMFVLGFCKDDDE